MNNIKLIVDSTCDLTVEEITKLNIEMIPMTVTIAGKDFKDIIDINPESMFRLCEYGKEMPKTSSITMGVLYTTFNKFVKQGYDVLYLSLSSQISSNYDHARMIAEEFDGHVQVFDTRNLSSSIYILIQKALKMIEQGYQMDKIINELIFIRSRIRCFFAIKSLKFLHAGGRCKAITYYVATMLHAHPIIEVDNGKLLVSSRVIGHMKKAFLKMFIQFKREYDRDNIEDNTIYLTDCLYPSAKAYLTKLITGLSPNIKIVNGFCGCVIASHSGEECCGFTYLLKK